MYSLFWLTVNLTETEYSIISPEAIISCLLERRQIHFAPSMDIPESAAVNDSRMDVKEERTDGSNLPSSSEGKTFVLKKWNALAIWSWDVECDTCAICRVHLMEECLKCQAESASECVVVWGECNHSFHNCCMSQWVRQNNRCPLCQQDWMVQRIGH